MASPHCCNSTLERPQQDRRLSRAARLRLQNTGGYDGLYYAQIAYHPALRDPSSPRLSTICPIGAAHPGPALAWLLAGGNPKWIVHVYSLFNVAAWLALAGLLWRLLEVNDRRSWIAWAGLMFSAEP